MKFLRWLGRNLTLFILSLALAVAVWVSAVLETDPNLERTFIRSVQVLGLEPNIEITSDVPDRIQVSIYAPSSNQQLLAEESTITAWIDLSGLGEGTHTVPVNYQISDQIRPLRVDAVTPQEVEISLEALITKTIPIYTEVRGEPALGYQVGYPIWSHLETVAYGRSSEVNPIAYTEAILDISGMSEDVDQSISLLPRNKDGQILVGIELEPKRVTVYQPITLMGGYRNMVVKVSTTGQVAEGYRQTSITVNPPNVMIFATDPAQLEQLPGYIETETLDLTGAIDDIETVLALNLPEGISVLGDDHVLVLVGVAAIEGSLTVTREVEVIGLLPGVEAQVAPPTVDVIVSGPIPDLENLAPVDVRVVVDLTGLEPGSHQLNPTVEILPDGVNFQSVIPETVEVMIVAQPTPTPSPTPTPAP